MIKTTYESIGGELQLQRIGEGRSPIVLCTLFNVQVRRESICTLSVFKDGELLGVLRFDESGYGISVGKQGRE